MGASIAIEAGKLGEHSMLAEAGLGISFATHERSPLRPRCETGAVQATILWPSGLVQKLQNLPDESQSLGRRRSCAFAPLSRSPTGALRLPLRPTAGESLPTNVETLASRARSQHLIFALRSR